MSKRLVRYGVVAALITGCFAANSHFAARADDPAATTSSTAANAPADAQTAPDESTALQIAEAYGHTVAVTSETNETSESVANPDGSFSLSTSPIPVRAQGPDGSWSPLDLSLQPNGSQLTPQTAAVPVKFSAGGDAPLAQVQAPSGDWLSETWIDGALPAPSVSGATATYAEVMPGVDLKVSATPVGMSEVLVVKDAQAAQDPGLQSVKFGVDDGAMSSTVNADGSLVTSSGGTPQLISDAPTWWDSSSPGASAAGPGGNGIPAPVAHTDTPTSITVDAASVATNPDVTYPVYVDPPSSFTGNRASYTFTDSAYPTTSYWNGAGASDAYAHVGYINAGNSDDGKAHTTRTFWSLDTNWLNGRYIVSAAFDATEVYSPSCTATNVELWTTGAASSSTTWANQDQTIGWSDHIATTAMAHGYNSSCPASAVGWDVTAAVQRAADAGYGAISLGMKATDETDWLSWKKFANDPHLDVRYYTRPSQPAYRSVGGCYAQCAAPVLTHDSTPTLTARSSADSGNTLYYKFEVWNGWSPTPTLDQFNQGGIASDTALGTTAAWTVGSALADGSKYEYRALACIGGTQVCGTQWSGWYTFQIDTTKPNPPKVTAVGNDFQFLAGQQTQPPTNRVGNVGTPGDIVIQPNGSTDDYQYVYTPETSLSVTATNAANCNNVTGDVVSVCNLNSDGSKQVTIRPQSWTSTLTLVAIDAAGNVSTGDTLGSSTSPDTFTYYPNGTLGGSAQHGWLEFDQGTGSGVADIPHASPSLTLTLAAGVSRQHDDPNNGVYGPYPGHNYDEWLSFSGASGAAATTASGSDVIGDATHSLSAAIWALPSATDDHLYHTAFSQDGAANSGFYIQRTPSDHWRACMPEMQAGGTAIDCTAESSASTDPTTWTLLVLTWDAPAKTLTLYVGDGNTHVTPLTRSTIAAAAGGQIVVGRAITSHALTDWWTGSLSDPLLYNVALGPDQINAISYGLATSLGGDQ